MSGGIKRSGLMLVVVISAAFVWASAALAAGPPSVEAESASHIGSSNATLEADIDPSGLETEYQFRVIGSPCLANPLTCEVEPDPLFPSTPGVIPPGTAVQSVAVDLEGAGMVLESGREYHYAVIAKNSDGTEIGADQTFTTATTPSVLSESATNVTERNATLGAQINPGGGSTGAYYQFQLVTKASEYASEILCPPTTPGFSVCIGTPSASALPIGFLSPGSEAHPVSLVLSDAGITLRPGTTYRYRVLVARAVQTEDSLEWQPPTVLGADQEFTTPRLYYSCAMSSGLGSCGGDPRIVPPRRHCRHRHHRRHKHHGKHGKGSHRHRSCRR